MCVKRPDRQTDSKFGSVFSETRFKLVEPDFVRTLKSCDVFEGSPFALECQVTGSPTPSVCWYKENVNIDNSPDYVITKINGTCTLRSKHSHIEHSGRYSCVAVNTAGEASSTARVNVICKHRSLYCGCATIMFDTRYPACCPCLLPTHPLVSVCQYICGSCALLTRSFWR